MAGPFKTCGSCKHQWPTWDEFVLDPAVRLLGLQSEITNPDVNLLVFEHDCGSSISILSRRLRHLLPEPEPDDPPARLLGTDQSRGHCLRLEDLEACDAGPRCRQGPIACTLYDREGQSGPIAAPFSA